jgi:subtilisin family serine protease
VADNSKGVAGVAPNARVAVCEALDSGAQGYVADVIGCMKWLARKRVAVISMSLGSSHSDSLEAAAKHIWRGGAGTLMVAAAGNTGDGSLLYPAAYAEVVSVASTSRTDTHSYFSNVNADVEIAAPGSGIRSTFVGGGYISFSGTSMSTPHAAGAAALMKLKRSDATAGQLRRGLVRSVNDLGAPGRDPEFGYGRLNLKKALRRACPRCSAAS